MLQPMAGEPFRFCAHSLVQSFDRASGVTTTRGAQPSEWLDPERFILVSANSKDLNAARIFKTSTDFAAEPDRSALFLTRSGAVESMGHSWSGPTSRSLGVAERCVAPHKKTGATCQAA